MTSTNSWLRVLSWLSGVWLAHAVTSASPSVHDNAVPAPGKTQILSTPDQVPDGLARSDWATIRAAYEAGRHAFMPTATGWQARNPGQQWTTQFDRRGFLTRPRDRAAGWSWGLELKGYGFSGAEQGISGVPGVQAVGDRLTYQWDASVQEWFVNDRHGLEHGFTVKERPKQPIETGSHKLELAFLLGVRGELRPCVTSDALGVEFRDAAGATVLHYRGLKVWDADGKRLASRFELAGSQRPEVQSQTAVRLLVDDRGARYPLTIDPTAQQAFLKASQVNTGDNFGVSVAVSGDTVVVGAYAEDSSTTGVNSTPDEAASSSGAAYVFVRSGTTWTQQAYLKAGQVTASDNFGARVAISGDTLVVGVPDEDSSTTGVNSTPDELASGAGAAYVFVRSGTTWTQQAYLKASQVNTSDFFGFGVAVSGDTVVVGAYGEDSSTTGVNSTPDEAAPGAGAAYVFVRSGTTWTQQAYLKASQVNSSDNFGVSVGLSGDTVVVGSRLEDSSTTGVNSTPNELALNAGAAYVFVRSGTTWTQQAYLKASQVSSNDQFGISVAVSDDTVVVGAKSEDSSTTGVNSTPDELASNSGAAYVFVRSGATWTQQAYLKASQVNASDGFGGSVAVSGDRVVVGAGGEDSSTTGVNSTPNELASGAGAAYVFVRSGTTWTQQDYLKASQVTASDQFGDGSVFGGYSVAVSGSTVVVGAIGEDSSTTGVNSTPDEATANTGAAYIFTLNSAPTDIALSSSRVQSGAAVNTTIGTFTATDADSGDTATFTLVSGTGSTDNAKFTISDGNTLKVAVSPVLSDSTYAIRVRVTDSGGATFEKQFTILVMAVLVDTGDYLVVDRGPYRSTGTILVVTKTGSIQRVVSTQLRDPYDIAVTSAGDFIVADYDWDPAGYGSRGAGLYKIHRQTGVISRLVFGSPLVTPLGVKVESSGTLLVADADYGYNTSNALTVNAGAVIRANADGSSPAVLASGGNFFFLQGMALAPSGDIYVANYANGNVNFPTCIVKVDKTTGTQTVITSGGLNHPVGLAVESDGSSLVVVDAVAKKLIRVTLPGGVQSDVSTDSQFIQPTHVAIETDGNYIVTDGKSTAGPGESRIYRVNRTTGVATILSSDGFFQQPRGVIPAL